MPSIKGHIKPNHILKMSAEFCLSYFGTFQPMSALVIDVKTVDGYDVSDIVVADGRITKMYSRQLELNSISTICAP